MEKAFCQNSDKFGHSFIKNDIRFMHLVCIYKKPIILKLCKIDTLNFAIKTNKLKKPFKNSNFFKTQFQFVFFTIKDDCVPL